MIDNYIKFEKLLDILNCITSNYKIVSLSEANSNKFTLYSHELHSIYPNNIKFQLLSKLFSNNFKKIFIKLYFKNIKIKKPSNNSAYLKLKLKNKNKELYIESLDTLMCFEDEISINSLKKLFKDTNSKLNINIIDNDIRIINNMNFRQPVKIKNITNCSFIYDEFGQVSQHLDHIDIKHTIYDQDIILKIKFKISIFSVYFILEFSEFPYDDYNKFVNLISEKIKSINELIYKEFKEEKKIFSKLLNGNFIFLKLKFSITNIDNVIEVLNKIKEINKINNPDIDKNYNYYKLLSNIIQDQDKMQIIAKFIEYNKDDIFLVKKKSNVEFDYKKYFYLYFNFKVFEIYIGIDEEKYLDFEMFKRLNIINSILSFLFTNDVIDEIEKCSLY